MSSTPQPRRAIVLGTSLSGKIASMVLADRLEVSAVVGPRPVHLGKNPEALSGKYAHSHAFLPRFIKEIDETAPFLSKAFVEHRLRRTPASRAFHWRASLHGTRLRAMRWQVEDLVTEEFGKRMSRHHLPAEVADAVVDGRVTALTLQDGQSLSVGPDTIIVDAMGANSPLMKAMSRRPGAPSVEDEPSNIGYVTQLFRLRRGLGSLLLPDPVADCAAHLGKAFVTLYEGADGWFSVTLAWDIRNKSTSSLLRDTASVTEFASRSPGVARWIAAAHSIGPSRRYMNPRNRWSLPLLASGSCPDNYIAIGDALTTTAPTLGAGCSWLSTHVRILAESLETGAGWRDRFLEIVTSEQRAFFDLSVATGAPAEIEPPPVKRKRTGAVRVLLSPILDREHHARIRDHIVNGSTL